MGAMNENRPIDNSSTGAPQSINRRQFLKRSGGATAATILAFHGLTGQAKAYTGESVSWSSNPNQS